MSLRDRKRQHQEAYEEAVRQGKLKPEIMKERPAGIVPCDNAPRMQPSFSFM